MRFRVIGHDESTGRDTVRDIVGDSLTEAQAWAALEGIRVDRIEPLSDPPGTPESTDAESIAASVFNERVAGEEPGPISKFPGLCADAEMLVEAGNNRGIFEGAPESSSRVSPGFRGSEGMEQASRTAGRYDPLGDPLRVLRRYVGAILLLQIPLAVGIIIYSLTMRQNEFGPPEMAVASIMLAFPFTFAFWRLLPNGPVDAMYLRSFRHDRDTAAIRQSLAGALGRRFRLSGIRDPRRRSIKVLRYLTTFIFALRYATPKYMNLEAGADWKGRLWRSLGAARCAMIDITDLTSFVIEEMRLCIHCLGLDRILFIGNNTKDTQTWRAEIERALEHSSNGKPVHIAIWESSARGRAAFEADVRRFVAQLPPSPAGLNPRAYPLAGPPPAINAPPSGRSIRVWGELVLGIGLAWAVWNGFNLAARFALPDWHGILLVPLVGLAICEVWHLILYVYGCGSMRERALTLATFGIAAIWMVGSVLGLSGAIGKVQESANRMSTMNNLKNIGLAFSNFESLHDRLPLADGLQNSDPPGKPPVSWRVTILGQFDDPEARRILDEYNHREPWDSPDNLRFIERMPKIYALPGAEKKTPIGHTYFRVFVSQASPKPQAAFTRGISTSFRSIVDGASQTILVVEAADPVPWTKPDDLEYDHDGQLPELGGHSKVFFHAVMADGLVRSFPSDMPKADLRAWITRNGSERIPER